METPCSRVSMVHTFLLVLWLL